MLYKHTRIHIQWLMNWLNHHHHHSGVIHLTWYLLNQIINFFLVLNKTIIYIKFCHFICVVCKKNWVFKSVNYPWINISWIFFFFCTIIFLDFRFSLNIKKFHTSHDAYTVIMMMMMMMKLQIIVTKILHSNGFIRLSSFFFVCLFVRFVSFFLFISHHHRLGWISLINIHFKCCIIVSRSLCVCMRVWFVTCVLVSELPNKHQTYTNVNEIVKKKKYVRFAWDVTEKQKKNKVSKWTFQFSLIFVFFSAAIFATVCQWWLLL